MTPRDFELLSDVVKQRSGLVLSKDKLYLLESRLTPLARKWGMTGLQDLATEIRARPKEQMLAAVTEAMTTNESSFFRDTRPFDNLNNRVLPLLLERRAAKRSLRIWSAACSTGQEPYSIAMALREASVELAGWRAEIVATDLSTEVLAKAKVGMYSQFEVQRGLPIQMLMKYFSQVNEMWQIDASIRAMVKFRELNLLKPLSSLGFFDIVFCRNVLIYFDPATIRSVLDSIGRIMPADGFLFLGGAETVVGVTSEFQPFDGCRGVYGLAKQAGH